MQSRRLVIAIVVVIVVVAAFILLRDDGTPATPTPEPAATATTAAATDTPVPEPTATTEEATEEPEATATPEEEATEEPEPTATPEEEATKEPEPTATPEEEATDTPEMGVMQDEDGYIVPHALLTDADGNCTTTVKLTMQNHGDYLDPNVDERYGLGLLVQQWDEGQPCVEVETVPMPPGDAPGWAHSQLIAGTPPDIISTWSEDSWFDNDWVISWDESLEAKNPYSENDTWYEDFPSADLLMLPYAADGTIYGIRCCIRTGTAGVDGILYNADILEAAGVDVATEMPPKTMTEFFDIQQRVLDNTDKIPFWLALAGDTRWEIDWYRRFIGDQLLVDVGQEMDAGIDDNDDQYGSISQMESVWGVLTGVWEATDPRVGEYFRIINDWSAYFQPGYASPPELLAEVAAEFLRGNVAMTTVGRWRIATVEQYPGLDFQWATFFMPPIDSEFSEYATGEPIRRHGGAGAPASTVMVPLYIPTQLTEDADKLAAAVDLIQYVTAPVSLDRYCDALLIPCFEAGTPVDEIFEGDPVRMSQMRAFFEPAPVDIPVVGYGNPLGSVQGGGDEVSRLMVEYFQGNMTLEELQTTVQDLAVAGATDICADKLEQEVAGWEWCEEYVE